MFHPNHLSFQSNFIFWAFLEHRSVYVSSNKFSWETAAGGYGGLLPQSTVVQPHLSCWAVTTRGARNICLAMPRSLSQEDLPPSSLLYFYSHKQEDLLSYLFISVLQLSQEDLPPPSLFWFLLPQARRFVQQVETPTSCASPHLQPRIYTLCPAFTPLPCCWPRWRYIDTALMETSTN